jgi:hypothetical protein
MTAEKFGAVEGLQQTMGRLAVRLAVLGSDFSTVRG